jgi:hypothetical protein
MFRLLIQARDPKGDQTSPSATVGRYGVPRGIGEIEMNADPKHKGGYDDADRAERARRHQETYTWGRG